MESRINFRLNEEFLAFLETQGIDTKPVGGQIDLHLSCDVHHDASLSFYSVDLKIDLLDQCRKQFNIGT